MPTRDEIRDVIDARMAELVGAAYTPNQAAIKAGLLDAIATGIVAWPGSGGGSTVHEDTVDPDENADESQGYAIGWTWINTATPEEFVCVDATNGAAVWLSTTSGISAAAAGVIAGTVVSAALATLATVASTGAHSDLSELDYASSGHTGFVPDTRTVNGHALSGNVTVTAADLSLVIGTNVQAWDTDLDAYAALATTGLVARTGSGTAAARTLTASSSRITVSNGDGVSGNPTLDVGPVAQIDVYTSAGTTSGHTVPTWAKSCRVIMAGGAGGSGSGRRAAAATNAMGGGGGTGGAYTDLIFDAAPLVAAGTYSTTVGAGGTAGAAVTVDSTNGNAGGDGGASSLDAGGVTYATAPGGFGGPGGTATSVSSATAANTWQWPSGSGGAPGTASSGIGGNAFVGPGGGGAGGWLTSAGGRNDGWAGGAGGKARDNHSGLAGGTGGGAAGTSATAPPNGFSGDGGSGGAASSAAAGGTGGAGTRGGGAGGGGASRNSNNSGAGNVGGDGWVIVIWS